MPATQAAPPAATATPLPGRGVYRKVATDAAAGQGVTSVGADRREAAMLNQYRGGLFRKVATDIDAAAG